MSFKNWFGTEKFEEWKHTYTESKQSTPLFGFLPAFILMPLAFSLYIINLAVCGGLVFIGGLFKFVLPSKTVHRHIAFLMHVIYRLWGLGNFVIMRLTNPIDWQVEGAEGLKLTDWYLLIANHKSWIDILVLTQFALFRIPAPKFFLKEELRWAPFIGMACWALDMPFMKRYSKKFIEKNPHLKGKDIETTRKSCESFQDTPTTIINFVEGTRFTAQKHSQTKSPFRNLLAPKAGGTAFTLATMGKQFNKVLNVTILYPDSSNNVMIDLLTGKLKRIIIHVEQIEVSESLIGDYFNDEQYKEKFQSWLNTKWQQKDILISRLNK